MVQDYKMVMVNKFEMCLPAYEVSATAHTYSFEVGNSAACQANIPPRILVTLSNPSLFKNDAAIDAR